MQDFWKKIQGTKHCTATLLQHLHKVDEAALQPCHKVRGAFKRLAVSLPQCCIVQKSNKAFIGITLHAKSRAILASLRIEYSPEIARI